MFRQTPSGPTFTQTPLLCVPEDEPEPDWAGVVAGAALAGAGAGAEVAGGLCFDVTWLGLEPPLRVVPPRLLPLLLVLPLPDPLRPAPLADPLAEPAPPDPAPVPAPAPPAAKAGVVHYLQTERNRQVHAPPLTRSQSVL
jgi:hypothetical protein